MEDELRYVHGKLIDAVEAVRAIKPDDRSAKARYCAIVITMLEQALAMFIVYVKDANNVLEPTPTRAPGGESSSACES